jgi:DNA mismatch repair protein MutS2
VRVPLQALRAGAPSSPSESSKPGGRRWTAPEERGRGDVPTELRLIGRTSEEARDLLEKYLDDAFLAGLASIRIIHGKGTGALRRTVDEVLSGHPLVAEHRAGAPHEGGAGATVAVMSQS